MVGRLIPYREDLEHLRLRRTGDALIRHRESNNVVLIWMRVVNFRVLDSWS